METSHSNVSSMAANIALDHKLAYFNMWDPMCQVRLGLVSCSKGSLSITSEDRTAKLVFFIVRYSPVKIGLENTSGLLTSAKAQVRKFLNI